MMRNVLAALSLLVAAATPAAQTRYTPTEFKIMLFKVEMSTDGAEWHSIFDDATAPENAPDRWSIEVRCAVLFD